MSKDYTYKDWLNDVRFSEWGVIPDGFLESSGLTEGEAVDVLYNDPYVLNFRGHLSDEEYRKILNAYRNTTKAVVEHFKCKIPAFIEALIEDVHDEEFKLNKRLTVIDDELSKTESARELDDMFSDTYPITPVTGSIYKEIVEENNVEEYLERFYESKAEPQISSVLPEIEKKQPKSFIKTALFYEERRLIKIKLDKQEISKDKILDKYDDIKRQRGESIAFDEIYEWLINEIGYTEEEVKNEFGIKLTFAALKKRLQRRNKSKSESQN